MKNQRTKSRVPERILFVWDGSHRDVRVADRFLKHLGEPRVYAVHALPHESIYSYGTVGQTYHETCELERNLTRAFRDATVRTDYLSRASFQLLFGDRVSEIARFASLIKATNVIAPLFEQSSFSRWIHGDLNSKLAKKLECRLVLLGNERNHSQLKSKPIKVQKNFKRG